MSSTRTRTSDANVAVNVAARKKDRLFQIPPDGFCVCLEIPRSILAQRSAEGSTVAGKGITATMRSRQRATSIARSRLRSISCSSAALSAAVKVPSTYSPASTSLSSASRKFTSNSLSRRAVLGAPTPSLCQAGAQGEPKSGFASNRLHMPATGRHVFLCRAARYSDEGLDARSARTTRRPMPDRCAPRRRGLKHQLVSHAQKYARHREPYVARCYISNLGPSQALRCRLPTFARSV